MNDSFQEELVKALRAINPRLTDSELEMGLPYFQRRTFKAKELISKAGRTAPKLFFAQRSITRCFYLDAEGEEQTLWMKPELTFIAEYKSFTSGERSQFSLQLYEDTEVWMIDRTDWLNLCQTHTNWALLGLQLTEQLHVTLIDVFVNLLANDATRNYEYIQYMFPRFLQVAPLKDIASMLQISQVSLSRIRAGTQRKR